MADDSRTRCLDQAEAARISAAYGVISRPGVPVTRCAPGESGIGVMPMREVIAAGRRRYERQRLFALADARASRRTAVTPCTPFRADNRAVGADGGGGRADEQGAGGAGNS